MTELTKPKPSQRTQIYQMLRANKGKSFTRIDFKTALKLNSIDNRYLTAMVAYGFASVTETEHGFAWQLVKDAGIEAPRFSKDGVLIVESGVNEAMWRAMRILKRFTRAELFAYVAKYTTEGNVKSYIKHLNQAGYLRLERKGIEAATYCLVQNTGPQPPQILRVKEVYDPNLDKIMLREVPEYE